MITVFGQIPDLFCAIYRHLKKKIERNFIQEKKYPPEKKQLSWFRCKTFFIFLSEKLVWFEWVANETFGLRFGHDHALFDFYFLFLIFTQARLLCVALILLPVSEYCLVVMK